METIQKIVLENTASGQLYTNLPVGQFETEQNIKIVKDDDTFVIRVVRYKKATKQHYVTLPTGKFTVGEIIHIVAIE